MHRFPAWLSPILLLFLLQVSFTVAADPAVETYKRFADAFIRSDFSTATSLSQGQAHEVIARKQALRAAGEVSPPPQETQFIVIAEKLSADGNSFRLNALQIVQPMGEGLDMKPPALHRQEVVLKKVKTIWRVDFFKDNLEKCCLD